MHSGMVPFILRCITVPPHNSSKQQKTTTATKDVDNSFSSTSTNETPVPADPTTSESSSSNSPSSWNSQSAQDTALFVILNLAVSPSGRDFLLNTDAVTLLSNITTSGAGLVVKGESVRPKEGDQLARFQCLKARMTLAYLLGCQGYYGQSKAYRTMRLVVDPIPDSSTVLQITRPEAEQLIQLLANTMHRRSKEGPGGYSAATFSLKCVLSAIRYLLTQRENQITFAKSNVEQLNALLMKVLGLYSLKQVAYLDPESAEHACFSLYLLSHYGFHVSFLESVQRFCSKRFSPRFSFASSRLAFYRYHWAGSIMLAALLPRC